MNEDSQFGLGFPPDISREILEATFPELANISHLSSREAREMAVRSLNRRLAGC